MKSDSNISFSGILYGKIGNRLTKGIVCCPHGDNKFVRFVNHIGKDAIKISCTNDGLDKILIETKEIPKINILEKIFFRVDKLQNKALRLRKSGKIDSFIFKLNELEFRSLKQDYPFITNKQLKLFAQIVKNAAPQEMQNFLDKFFGK